ncbi:MAG: HEAT repeat domain-containing protein [Elusimicrobiota bacterium]
MILKAMAFFALAGLAGQGWCAEMETLRSQGLPDAGSIMAQIQQQGPHFVPPAPHFPSAPQTTIDMCVFTEFKNNKCHFKCESGATLVEPAVRPDFGSGEPAGACATHIFRPVPSPFAQFNKHIDSSDLRDLLRDPNPEVRKAAVKASRNYIHNSYAQDPVRDMLGNRNERLDIRVEAARVLSHAAGNSRVQDELTEAIRYGNEPRELRVMAYKALWSVAGSHSRVQDFLTDAVKYSEKDREARRAAIWALFPAVGNSRPQETLTGLLRYGNEDEETRIEAIKSLYNAMGHYRVRDLMMELVKNSGERKPVRLAAIKALSGANGDPRVRDLLEDIMERSSDTDLRLAAIEAASPNPADIRDYFHLPYKLENGVVVSPLDRE